MLSIKCKIKNVCCSEDSIFIDLEDLIFGNIINLELPYSNDESEDNLKNGFIVSLEIKKCKD